ncbi:MAG: metal-dependent hydrolase [Sulfobacillus sp.]
MQLRYLGHAAAHLTVGGAAIYVDPFLTGNPMAPPGAADLPCDFVLLSHYHSDHLGDTVELAKRNQATVLTTNEIALELQSQGVQAVGMHIGGQKDFPFGHLKLVLAQHGSGISGGLAAGFVVGSEGKKVYFAGDTALYSDMKLLRQLWGPIDLALLPIGSHYTMDAKDAQVAVEWIDPTYVIPIHYDTFPAIEADGEAFKRAVESTGRSHVVLLAPGATFDL